MQNCLAKAIYDNVAETPDELNFQKNDVLTVLEQNTSGLEGWWLCSFKGKQGICPGNRLRLIAGLFDSNISKVHRRLNSSEQFFSSSNTNQLIQATNSGKLLFEGKKDNVCINYDTPRLSLTNDYSTPPSPVARFGGEEFAVSVKSSNKLLTYSQESCPEEINYDIPKNLEVKSELNYDSPKSVSSFSRSQTPHSLIKGIKGGRAPNYPSLSLEGHYSTPPLPIAWVAAQNNHCNRVSFMSTESSSSSSSGGRLSSSPSPPPLSLNRGGGSSCSSSDHLDIYDIPPEPRKLSDRPLLPPRQIKSDTQVVYDLPRPVVGSFQATPREMSPPVYDVPPQVSHDTVDSKPIYLDLDIIERKNIFLNLDEALDILHEIEERIRSGVDGVQIAWEGRVGYLQEALKLLVSFTERAAGCATCKGHVETGRLLLRLMKPVKSGQIILENTVARQRRELTLPKDAQSQMIAVTNVLLCDVKHLTSVIETNSTLIFDIVEAPVLDKDKTPVFENPIWHKKVTDCLYQNDTISKSILEDYDYVRLDANTMDDSMKNKKSSTFNSDNKSFEDDRNGSLVSPNDRKIISFYSSQSQYHLNGLNQAISEFLTAVEKNNSPKIFVCLAKDVVVTAHRLVYVADATHHHIISKIKQQNILAASDKLCDGLQAAVATAKTAAIQFPAVAAVQIMVDSFARLSDLGKNVCDEIVTK